MANALVKACISCRLIYVVVIYSQMRISGGIAKGRRTAAKKLLKVTAEGERLRPTSSKVREALFDIVRSRIEGARFVDLYAGTGTIGLEALSRGAREAVFIEPDARRTASIRKNLIDFGFDAQALVVHGTAEQFLQKASARTDTFDIFFVDPPYQTDEIEKVLPLIGQDRFVSEDGVVIVEHFFKRDLPLRAGKLSIAKTYRYGDTMLTLYRKAEI
jgi:16S rRNA (guanine(966)-N(2))-methyltransferase RsmD